MRKHPAHPYRVFTLEEANGAVPEVARLTAEVQQRLNDLRLAFDDADPEAGHELEANTRDLLISWQEAIREIGAEPKGIFTVDFRTPDPNVLWCWTIDEPSEMRRLLDIGVEHHQQQAVGKLPHADLDGLILAYNTGCAARREVASLLAHHAEVDHRRGQTAADPGG